MCFMRAPKVAAKPATPSTRDNPSAESLAQQEEEKKRAKLAKGRRATILTSGLGASSFGEAGGRATLLGQTS